MNPVGGFPLAWSPLTWMFLVQHWCAGLSLHQSQKRVSEVCWGRARSGTSVPSINGRASKRLPAAACKLCTESTATPNSGRSGGMTMKFQPKVEKKNKGQKNGIFSNKQKLAHTITVQRKLTHRFWGIFPIWGEVHVGFWLKIGEVFGWGPYWGAGGHNNDFGELVSHQASQNVLHGRKVHSPKELLKKYSCNLRFFVYVCAFRIFCILRTCIFEGPCCTPSLIE